MDLEKLNPGYVVRRGSKKEKEKICVPRNKTVCVSCGVELWGVKAVRKERYGDLQHYTCFACWGKDNLKGSEGDA